MKVVIAAVVVSMVILTECVLAFLLIPSTAAVEARLGDDHGETPAAEAKEKPDAYGGGHGGGHEKKPAKADAHGGGHGSHDKPKADKGHGGGHGGGHGSHDKPKAKGGGGDAHGNAEVETDLGRYNVVVHQPATGVTLRVNFHLYGTVAEASHEEADELAKKNQHRLRDSVIIEIRNSDIADLTDPGLALIKRKILAKSNELLGQPLLKGVVFSDFSFVEQ